jgi:tetratricopeptide (TPR) repeat protein
MWICASVLTAALTTWPVPAHPAIDAQIADVTARLELEPENAELFLRRGELHRIHQDWAAAEADFVRAKKADPKLYVVDFHLGRAKLEAGQAAQAKKTLDRFLARSPDHVECRVARARALVEMGRAEAAVSDYTEALAAIGPEGRPIPTYYLERSKALESLGRLDQAILGLDEGLDRLGQPVTLQLYAIELELLRGRHDAALSRLERIASASPRKETWLVRRGEILERAGRQEEAREAYSGALEAIESLPRTRRWNRAVQQLELSAETALERLPLSDAEMTTRRPSLQ